MKTQKILKYRVCLIQHLMKSVVLDRFQPAGSCMDMATAIFNRLVKIYTEENLDKVKECEFLFRDLSNRKASTLGEHSSKFKNISLSMLPSTSPEPYIHALKTCKILLAKRKIFYIFKTG